MGGSEATGHPRMSDKSLKEFRVLLRLAEFYNMKSVEEFKKAQDFAIENGIYIRNRHGATRRIDKPKFMIVDPILTSYKQKEWQPIDYLKMYGNNFY